MNEDRMRKGPRRWTRIEVPSSQALRRRLQQRHWLRLHALCIGAVTLVLMLGASAGLLHLGVTSMAVRYALALSLAYLAYLLLVRVWAECMLRRAFDDDPWSSVDVGPARQGDAVAAGGGGDFGGGGAQGAWAEAPVPGDGAADGLSEGLGQAVEGAGSALDGADDGAVVLIPVLAVFALLLAAMLGAGWLAWLLFSTEVLLAVAVEVAFALLLARTLYRIEREGWLLAAVRLSWKPLLAALVCAVLVGAVLDHVFPQADTARQAVKQWRGR
jgi:hypothetical protein